MIAAKSCSGFNGTNIYPLVLVSVPKLLESLESVSESGLPGSNRL
jgi:hypothetical protein